MKHELSFVRLKCKFKLRPDHLCCGEMTIKEPSYLWKGAKRLSAKIAKGLSVERMLTVE